MSIDVLFSSSEQKEVTFEFKGEKVVVKIKEIGWSEKNKILSKCFQYKNTGEISFEFDTYNKEMLKRIIIGIQVGDVVVPQSEINDIFFARLNPTFGGMLEKLVPKAFEELNTSDFFGKGSNKS